MHSSQSPAVRRVYSYWFYAPGMVVFAIFFLAPTALAFYFSLTRWTLFDSTFIGLDNYALFSAIRSSAPPSKTP